MASRPFPTRFAVLPSSSYVFDQQGKTRELSCNVVVDRMIGNDLRIVVANCGLIAFDFKAGDLGPFDLKQETTSGVLSDDEIASRERMQEIQARRRSLAFFFIACIYGRHAHLTNATINKPRYSGLDEIFNWDIQGNPAALLLTEHDRAQLVNLLHERIVAIKAGLSSSYSIPVTNLNDALDMAERIRSASALNEKADYVSLIEMAYQAMVLHSLQHAGASIALSATILEVLVEELFYIVGLVNGTACRLQSSITHKCALVSKSTLKDMGAAPRIDYLKQGGVLDPYLADRLTEVRNARNGLMHRGKDVRSPQSGNALTVVRDLLRLCTGEEFVLNAGWAYRT